MKFVIANDIELWQNISAFITNAVGKSSLIKAIGISVIILYILYCI